MICTEVVKLKEFVSFNEEIHIISAPIYTGMLPLHFSVQLISKSCNEIMEEVCVSTANSCTLHIWYLQCLIAGLPDIGERGIFLVH